MMCITGLIAVFVAILAAASSLFVHMSYLALKSSVTSDINTMRTDMSAIKTDVACAAERALKSYDRLTDVDAELGAARKRDAATEESLKSINTKLASRARAEKRLNKQQEVQLSDIPADDDDDTGDEIPGTIQQQLQLFPPVSDSGMSEHEKIMQKWPY